MKFRAKNWTSTLLVAALGLAGLSAGNARAADQHITPSSSLQTALNNLSSGDTLYLGPGDYYPPQTQAPFNHLLLDGKNGTATSFVTVRNEPGQAKPKIHLGGALPNGFTIRNGSYVRVDGLEIVGGDANDNGTNGFSLGNIHHVQIVNCVVHDMGASGISFGDCSQVLIENNICYGNCRKAAYGPSGISIYHPKMKSQDNTNFAGTLGNPSNYYAIIVRNNTCYDNVELVPDAASHSIIDGNGIIIDDFKDSQNQQTPVPFPGYTLVVNNVCFNNGARGIHVFQSDKTDVFNNTLYKNQQNLTSSDIDNYGVNNRFWNNIIVPNNKVGSASITDPTVLWEKNLYFNATSHVTGTNDLTGDPKFVSPGTTGSADFHLQAGSPAIDAGKSVTLTYDRDSVTRTAPEDLGAYEYVAATNFITRIRFWPRSGFLSRTVGGQFQSSNSADFSSGVTTLFTISSTPVANQWTDVTVSTTNSNARYVRYLSPNGGWGNINEVEFYSGSTKVTGTVIGTTGSYNNSGADRTKVFDGDTSTFFDAPVGDGVWAGLDLNASSPVTRTLNASADATVRDGSYASTNFGSATTVDVKNSSLGYNRIGYFKFDISAGSGTVFSAKLRVYGVLSGADVLTIGAFSVADTSWSETAITWNNKPALGGTALSSLAVSNTTGAYTEWNVTNYLNAQKAAGATSVTLALNSTSGTSNSQAFYGNSRENTSNPPQLVVISAQ